MTPHPVAAAMSRMMIDDTSEANDGKRIVIQDPCCGTGILLIEAAKENVRAELCGIDIDSRCADICAINLGLRSCYGWVICGNTLSRKVQYAYRIGSFFHEGPNGRRRGVIRKVPPEQCPVLPELHRQSKSDLLSNLDPIDVTEPKPPNPFEIVEIPNWLLRLEAQQILSQHDEVEHQKKTIDKPVHKDEAKRPDSKSDSPKPGHLF